ncbi:putative membrane protein [Alteromonadaceae bacterium Bs31]|nr:putative membrane protein [Alteromonadaceae bacterium Bs31]
MTSTNTKRSIRDYFFLLLKGMGMGAADVVPGVSGGTIAFITGIYDELLHSLKQIGPQAVVILFKEGIASAWRHINGNFLVAVFGGILVSLKTFAALIGFCLDNYPLLVWAFFSGLIGASIIVLLKQQQRWQWSQYLACLFGALFVFAISISSSTELPGYWWMLFLGGFVAICAMILPGISGSFILLLVGLYPVFLDAITELNLVALLSFGVGCVAGLLVFSRFLSWLLDNFHQATMATLVGFLIGSLNVTWPWKQTIETTLNRHGEVIPLVQKNVLPVVYQSTTGEGSQLLLAILLAVLGLALVLLVDFLSHKYSVN